MHFIRNATLDKIPAPDRAPHQNQQRKPTRTRSPPKSAVFNKSDSRRSRHSSRQQRERRPKIGNL